MNTLEALWITMRPYRVWRLGILLIPFLISGNLLNIVALLKLSIGAFILFLLTGAINIIDDITDKEKDKNDIIKKAMPVASGSLSIEKAEFSAGLLLICSFVSAFFLDNWFGVACVAYLAIELLYHFQLKKFEIIDAITISMESCALLFAGMALVGMISLSWLFVFIIALSIFLVFSEQKRRLLLSSEGAYSTLPKYSDQVLEQLVSIMACFALVIYSLFSLTSLQSIGNNMAYTLPFVIFAVLRIVLLTNDKSKDLPLERMLIKDKMTWIVFVLWVIMLATLNIAI